MSDPGRFLIASWDGGGNTPPAYNLGARLIQLGHRVRLIGWDTMARRAAAAGVEFATYPSVAHWPDGLSQDEAIDERLKPALLSRATRDDILAESKLFAPDVMVVDCMLGSGFDAARMLGLPIALLVHVLYSRFRYEWGSSVMERDMAPILDGADATLALVPPGFDVPCPLPANTAYVGPITAPTSREHLDPIDSALLAQPGDPWVLLSLSTTLQRQTEALPAMLDAVARLPVRVLLTLGGVLPTGAIDAPANVTVRGFLPHHLVLPHMAAVICHGGLSTITGALAAGVRIVCIPQGREQPLNAERVAASGVGRVVATDAPAAEIAATLMELLEDPAAPREARRFADVIAGLGCGDRATRKVVSLLSRPYRSDSLGKSA
ncbi:MAG: glycosyltransferase [Candidatus Dormibacteraeota bacterium]|nr:glycosyltransferase [Candidatus Dormibacteraeota bacterium]